MSDREKARAIVNIMIESVNARNQKGLADILGITSAAISDSISKGRVPKRWYEIIDKLDNEVLEKEKSPLADKILATIQPGDAKKIAKLKSVKRGVTETDNSLRILIEWMDEYFGNDPDQILPFVFDLARQYPSFANFLEKKQTSGDYFDTRTRPVSKKCRG